MEWVVASDVGIQNEEGRVVFAKGFLRQLERASRSKWFSLNGEFDIDVVFFLVLKHG